MKSKRVLFIGLFVISIVGLAVVQYRYLNIGISLARLQFSRQIAEAGSDIRAGLYTRNQLTYLLETALEEDSTRFNTGLDHMTNASRHFMEDFLREKLIDNQIDADFSYALMTRDSTYYLASGQVREDDSSMFTYPMELHGYLPSRLGQRVILQLNFPDLNRYFLLQLNGLVLPSLLFIAGLLVAVLWVLRTYYWQQRTITTTHEFINNLTHELRTPVFSISLAAKILRDKVTEPQKPLVDTILAQTGRVSDHIDQVLELGSLEKGSASIPLEPVDFKPILEELCRQFATRCSLENISFDYRITDAGINLQASAFHLENAINNLLDNARKYGGGKAISLDASTDERWFTLTVTDMGPGISKDEQEKIFRKYYRISKGDRQDVRGYGLGLSYVKTVVDRHRGKIQVSSEPGRGTAFTIQIPLDHHGK